MSAPLLFAVSSGVSVRRKALSNILHNAAIDVHIRKKAEPSMHAQTDSPIHDLLVRNRCGSDGELSLNCLRRAAAHCQACDLWKNATQTVFGEGSAVAKIMLIGEQPGDQEDLSGRPFVGPAGRILQDAMLQAGIDPDDVYLTNVVKHFRWSRAQRGKRRIHKKPRQSEIDACRPWLDAEMESLRPDILVCLGATAAKALLGKTFSIRRQRGELVPSPLAPYVLATTHPSAILRSPDPGSRHEEMRALVADLRIVERLFRKLHSRSENISTSVKARK